MLLGAALAPDPAGAAPTTFEDLEKALQTPGATRIPDGTYRTSRKLRTVLPKTIVGDSRQNTLLLPQRFRDYVLEVGDGNHPGPNAGLIQRLRLYGEEGNLGCLHMNRLSHMWVLTELIFSGGHCPALLVENCWDSNYTNIDVLGHYTPAGDDPSRHAAVIFKDGCNNIYCRGFRIEGAFSGGLYVDGAPIYVTGGKVDDGFSGPQTAAAITVASGGALFLDDFYLGGVLHQFAIDVAGALKLGHVSIDGGTGKIAAINDRRAWRHLGESSQASSAAAAGPSLPDLDLGSADFRRFHPSVDTDTPAAVFSRIHPIRQVQRLTIRANGQPQAGSIRVRTDLKLAHDHQYKNSFLVHNSTGIQVGDMPGARRRILDSLGSGDLLLQGSHPVTVDSDWSIEFCAGHYTPLRHRNCRVGGHQELFAVVCAEATLEAPAYVAAPGEVAYGTTRFRIKGEGLTQRIDLTGLFLVDNASGEPYYIQYGIDAGGLMGVMYDRASELGTSQSFSVVAGYPADVQRRGSVVSWTHGGTEHRVTVAQLRATGFGPDEIPLWAFAIAAR